MEVARPPLNSEPRYESEYSPRQTEAARRVLIDLGQVLAAFEDCLVVVGGWVPDLLLKEVEEPHVGSIDVDLAIDAEKLTEGRYAKLVEALLNTRRYKQAEEPFKLFTMVDLNDGDIPVRVDVDFLKSADINLRRSNPKLMDGFRPLDAAGCAAAFSHPELVVLAGQMPKGGFNTVQLRVASVPDFLVMKSYALKKRDKPKDAYDICYCLDHFPGGAVKIAEVWNVQPRNKHVTEAIEILKEKFSELGAYGPSQVVEFHNSAERGERERQQRRAFELVQHFLSLTRGDMVTR
jgi:predicted nucleotidyltransferase